MIRVGTERGERREAVVRIVRSDGVRAPVSAGAAADGSLRDWCEQRSHPCGRLSDGECFCGLVRYDE